MSFFDLPPIIERMLMVSDKISDLNFSVGQLPQVEINGKLTPVQPLGMQKLSPYQTEIIAMTLMHGHPDAAERGFAQCRQCRRCIPLRSQSPAQLVAADVRRRIFPEHLETPPRNLGGYHFATAPVIRLIEPYFVNLSNFTMTSDLTPGGLSLVNSPRQKPSP